jgi:glycosyltransferase involved in cell wall biosynthesis
LNEKVGRKRNFLIIPDLIREIRPLKDLKALIQTIKALRQIRPHILHTHSTKAGIIGRVAAFLLRVPVRIHSVHGFAFSPLQSLPKRTVYYLVELLVSPITSHFVFVARADIGTAKKRGLVRKRYTLIRSGFPAKPFQQRHSDTEPIKRTYGIKQDQIVCGVIAPFKAQKGLFHLIDVAQRVIERDQRAIFFLAGDGELRTDLEAELRKREIAENFRLPGFLFNLDRVMDIFDIGVTTALWEGLPQSLVQMRLKKIPVVASDIPGNREIIKHHKNGLLAEVSDHQALADHILYLMGNRRERVGLGNFSDDFSQWDAAHMVKAQERLYQSLLNIL